MIGNQPDDQVESSSGPNGTTILTGLVGRSLRRRYGEEDEKAKQQRSFHHGR